MPVLMLMNLDNDVDFMRAQDANVNFNGAGAGNNHVGSLDAGAGANINFGLQNLRVIDGGKLLQNMKSRNNLYLH